MKHPAEYAEDAVRGSPETMTAARAIIEKYPTIDMHTHAGRVFTPKGDLDDTKRGGADGVLLQPDCR